MSIGIAIGSIVTTAIMYLFVMPAFKSALFGALCGIGATECLLGLLAFYVIPAIPIILLVLPLLFRYV